MMRTRLSRNVLVLALVVLGATLGGCVSGGITIATEHRTVRAADGYPLQAYTNFEWSGGREFEQPRGVLFYIQGSEDASVLGATERFAGACAMGMDVVMIERRGVQPDAAVDRATATKFATKPQRVADHRAAINDYLARVQPGGPVILVGASEGGDVAAAVAAVEPRVTHVVLMGSGGGWTQAEEFRWFIAEKGGYLGMASVAELDAQLAAVRADADGDAEWLGHPRRRWATFMFDRPADDLLKVNVPILLLQGDADENVPVGSARALRDAFAAAGRTNLRYVEYAGVDHRFRRADGSSVFPLVEVDIVGWMRDTGALGKAEADEFVRRVRRAHPESFDTPAK